MRLNESSAGNTLGARPMTAHLDALPDPSRCALVLGSSFLGVYAHSGFLNGLEASGFRPARLAGSSAGALAGGLFAAGLRGKTLRETVLSAEMRHAFLDAGAFWRAPGVVTTLWSTGLFSGKRCVAHLRNLVGDTDLDGLGLDIAVTDADSARTVIRRQGPLSELIMASCAVPGLFTVQRVEGQRFLDGGIAAEFPFEHLLDNPEIDTIVLHRIRHQRKAGRHTTRQTLRHVIGKTYGNACREFHRIRTDLAAAGDKQLIELVTETPFPGLLSRRHDALCYQRGHETAHAFAANSGEQGSRQSS